MTVSTHRAPMTFTARCSAFSIPVGDVICVSAEKQVRGIATARIVATVANAQSIGNGAISQFPGDTVSVDVPASMPDMNVPAVFACEAAALPTRVSAAALINSLCKSLDNIATPTDICATARTEAITRAGRECLKDLAALFTRQPNTPLSAFIRAVLCLLQFRRLDMERLAASDADNVWGKIGLHSLGLLARSGGAIGRGVCSTAGLIVLPQLYQEGA